jgi:plastocyanin
LAVVLLITKVAVVRYLPNLSRFIPFLGTGLLASLIAIWFLTAYWYWFSDGSAYTGSEAASAVVKIVDAQGVPGRFQPGDVTIKAGQVVQWDQESAGVHTVSGQGFDSGPNGLSQGQNFKFQFQRAGTFNYVCNFHPSMRGTVTVSGSSARPGY